MTRFSEGGSARASRFGLLALAVAFGLAQGATGARASTWTAPSSCTSSGGVKPLIRGLVDRNIAPPAANLDASSINVDWDVLEPDGEGLIHPNPIDTAIANGGCTPIRLRVLAGIATPQWVLDQTGSVDVTNPYSNTSGVAGDFWTSEYSTLYDNLETELANVYGSAPNIVEFVVSRCALFYPEPFILGTSIPSNDTNLVNAGYSEAADQQCQQEEIDTANTDWPTTRIGVSFNPYQVLNAASGSLGYTTAIDEGYTEQVMAYCRYTLGTRCVLENDSIRDPISGLGPNYPQMYAAMTGADGPVELTLNAIDKQVSLGAPIAFQTATESNVGDFWGTLEWARTMHASSVELPVDGTYPSSGGSGAPAWQTLTEVAKWFGESPSVTAIPLTVVQGKSTLGTSVATVTLDGTAAIDTKIPYGDIGSVPFDTVTADIYWPTGVQQTGLISIAGSKPAVSATCSTRTCSATIKSAGYPFPELKITKPATVVIMPATGGVQYTPADGVPIVAIVPVTSNPAPLTIKSLSVTPAKAVRTVNLKSQFTDADRLGVATNYVVRITWGDGGTVTSPPATASGSGFAVTASHQYAGAGKYTVTITINDPGGATVSTSESVTVH
jgi:hypothetical protein